MADNETAEARRRRRRTGEKGKLKLIIAPVGSSL